ncbi:MAG TPA: amidohydrolase family protein [Dehalococcoidia bacterium]|nr:amidohydrolase family protein [Dehalococcoidia bacterium]
MEIKYGLISADSHAAFDRDDFTSRMSAVKWGDRIPHVAGYERNGEHFDGWSIYGRPPSGNVCNCPALMGEPFPHWPKRWEEVPRMAYVPTERLKALDIDRVDAEVLFPNPPGGSYHGYGDPEFELDVVRAYNDALAEWVRVSDRYIPLAILPWLQEPKNIAQEIERAVEGGHRGVDVMGRMPGSLPHLTDPHWYPIWETCQGLGVPIHFHGSAGLNAGASIKQWSGYSERQAHSASTSTSAVTPAQIVPQLVFTGLTERFPNLKVVFAEAGIGGLNYAIAACDHEWESRHLWTEGLPTRPSEAMRRQVFVNFWFEAEGIKLRHEIGIDNIMWEADLPHVASYYPRSWDAVERVLAGVPEADRSKLLYENAVRVYQLKAKVPA